MEHKYYKLDQAKKDALQDLIENSTGLMSRRTWESLFQELDQATNLAVRQATDELYGHCLLTAVLETISSRPNPPERICLSGITLASLGIRPIAIKNTIYGDYTCGFGDVDLVIFTHNPIWCDMFRKHPGQSNYFSNDVDHLIADILFHNKDGQ